MSESDESLGSGYYSSTPDWLKLSNVAPAPKHEMHGWCAFVSDSEIQDALAEFDMMGWPYVGTNYNLFMPSFVRDKLFRTENLQYLTTLGQIVRFNNGWLVPVADMKGYAELDLMLRNMQLKPVATREKPIEYLPEQLQSLNKFRAYAYVAMQKAWALQQRSRVNYALMYVLTDDEGTPVAFKSTDKRARRSPILRNQPTVSDLVARIESATTAGKKRRRFVDAVNNTLWHGQEKPDDLQEQLLLLHNIAVQHRLMRWEDDMIGTVQHAIKFAELLIDTRRHYVSMRHEMLHAIANKLYWLFVGVALFSSVDDDHLAVVSAFFDAIKPHLDVWLGNGQRTAWIKKHNMLEMYTGLHAVKQCQPVITQENKFNVTQTRELSGLVYGQTPTHVLVCVSETTSVESRFEFLQWNFSAVLNIDDVLLVLHAHELITPGLESYCKYVDIFDMKVRRLPDMTFKFVKSTGNGACMFNTLSLLLTFGLSEHLSKLLRRWTVQELSVLLPNNTDIDDLVMKGIPVELRPPDDRQASSLTFMYPENGYRNKSLKQAYLEWMSQHTTYGGYFELTCLCRKLKICSSVVVENGNTQHSCYSPHCGFQHRLPYALYFSGGNHYDLLFVTHAATADFQLGIVHDDNPAFMDACVYMSHLIASVASESANSVELDIKQTFDQNHEKTLAVFMKHMQENENYEKFYKLPENRDDAGRLIGAMPRVLATSKEIVSSAPKERSRNWLADAEKFVLQQKIDVNEWKQMGAMECAYLIFLATCLNASIKRAETSGAITRAEAINEYDVYTPAKVHLLKLNELDVVVQTLLGQRCYKDVDDFIAFGEKMLYCLTRWVCFQKTIRSANVAAVVYPRDVYSTCRKACYTVMGQVVCGDFYLNGCVCFEDLPALPDDTSCLTYVSRSTMDAKGHMYKCTPKITSTQFIYSPPNMPAGVTRAWCIVEQDVDDVPSFSLSVYPQ